MRPRTNGVSMLETEDGTGQPYKLWHGDLWECPACGEQVLAGFGAPIEKGHPSFEPLVLAGVDVTINGRMRALAEGSE